MYVGDLLMTGPPKLLQKTITLLKQKFLLETTGDLDSEGSAVTFLGRRLQRVSDSVVMNGTPNYYEPLANLKAAFAAGRKHFRDALVLRQLSLLIGLEARKIKDWAVVQGAKYAARDSRLEKEKYWRQHSNYSFLSKPDLEKVLKSTFGVEASSLPKPVHKVDISRSPPVVARRLILRNLSPLPPVLRAG